MYQTTRLEDTLCALQPASVAISLHLPTSCYKDSFITIASHIATIACVLPASNTRSIGLSVTKTFNSTVSLTGMSDTRSSEMATSTADSSDAPPTSLRVKTGDTYATGVPGQKSPASSTSDSVNTPPHSEASGGGSVTAIPGNQKTQAAFISKLYK